LEMRAVPDFRDMVTYLEERMAAKGQSTTAAAA
jgi:hypothetical protein